MFKHVCVYWPTGLFIHQRVQRIGTVRVLSFENAANVFMATLSKSILTFLFSSDHESCLVLREFDTLDLSLGEARGRPQGTLSVSLQLLKHTHGLVVRIP